MAGRVPLSSHRMGQSSTSCDCAVWKKLLIFECIWWDLTLYLTESTFEDVQVCAGLCRRRCRLICNRKRTAGTVKPVLLLMPTLSDFGIKHAERCYKMSDGHQDAPLDENRVLRGRVELEDPGLALGRVLAANDGRAVCLSPWEGGQALVNDELRECERSGLGMSCAVREGGRWQRRTINSPQMQSRRNTL